MGGGGVADQKEEIAIFFEMSSGITFGHEENL